MSGDSLQEAVTAFLEPFRAALGVLDGRGDIVIPRRGSLITSKDYSWVLNPERGMKLGDVGTLYASMRFQVLDYGRGPKEFGKRFRVTILGYNYRLEQPNGGDRWRMHWHPDGVSNVKEPHLHIPPDLKAHRRCDQMTFENAIRWCIADRAPLTCTPQEAEDELSRWQEPPDLGELPVQRGGP